MGTFLNIGYKGKDIAVLISTAIEKERVIYLCHLPNTEIFEIELTKNASWVIVGKPVVSADLVELIGNAYLNSILF